MILRILTAFIVLYSTIFNQSVNAMEKTTKEKIEKLTQEFSPQELPKRSESEKIIYAKMLKKIAQTLEAARIAIECERTKAAFKRLMELRQATREEILVRAQTPSTQRAEASTSRSEDTKTTARPRSHSSPSSSSCSDPATPPGRHERTVMIDCDHAWIATPDRSPK